MRRPDPQAEFEHVLFLTVQGRSITPNRLTMIVREYIRAADTGKGGSCHAFRHSLAMGMLDNGADIRHVQAQLGHADIGTTQIYFKRSRQYPGRRLVWATATTSRSSRMTAVTMR